MLHNLLKKRYCKIVIIGFVCLMISLAFGITIQKKNTKDIINNVIEPNLTEEVNDFSYLTMQVTDYELKTQFRNYTEWQSRYSILTSSSTLYVDDKVYKEDVSVSNLDEIISFYPEDINQEYDYSDKIKEQDTGILYEFLIKESEEYVASLLQKGYVLRRKILTSTYAEVYLFDHQSNTIRVIAFKDKMLTAKIDNNELPEIESYFK